jgi:sigma-E factor negative regulatory protein RseB
MVACLAGSMLMLPVYAQQAGTGDALQWLQRVATASQKLTYSGVFVYQSGSRRETSRITHLVEGSGEYERLEALDGSPREVVRENDEVKCFLPESRLLIVERRGSRRTFPALLPGSLAGLTEYYSIRKGATGRIAGLESFSILIEPKDELRYGYQLWVDPQTGLLLKAGLVNEKGEALETFAFTELKIGGPVDRQALKSGLEKSSGDWQVYNVRSSEARNDDGQWTFRNALPGFRRMSSAKRQLRPGAPEGTHMIFSDGLAAVSVFFEPQAGPGSSDVAPVAMGAINVYKRHVGDTQLVVMGDVPAAALRRFADGIEPRKK